MTFYDHLETRSRDEREAALFAALPRQIRHAKENTRHFGRLFAEIDPAAVKDRAALARLPLTRKSELNALQKADPPLGGLVTVPLGRLKRLFASPGPVYDPEPEGADPWRTARALFASGFRAGDVVQNSFAYHLTPAGAMFEAGARALGCAVIPAGTGNSELQAQAMAQLRPRAYVGTPDFLKVILEKADEQRLGPASIEIAHVTGGPYLPDARAYYQGCRIAVLQSYGTADLGIVAYETAARDGLVIDEGVIVEIVRPGTGNPVPEGEVGEVVVTGFDPVYPLIRFATGDLSAMLPGESACGRTNFRLAGWLGRADQTTKIRGMFVHPVQVEEVIRRHPQIRRARLVVGRAEATDTMTLRCETGEAGEDLAAAVRETLAAVTKLNGRVELVPFGGLPNDGKVIEDARGI